MAVAYRSQSVATYSARINTTLTPPAGLTNGDIMLVFIGGGANNVEITPPAAPAGWTQIGTTHYVKESPGSNWTDCVNVWYKRANNESGNYTWTVDGGLTRDQAALLLCYSGCAQTGSPIDTFSYVGGSGQATSTDTATGTGTVATAASITTSVANTLLVNFIREWTDIAGAISPTSTWTERYDATGQPNYAQEKAQAAVGATGTVAATVNGSSFPWQSWLIALKPDVVAYVPPLLVPVSQVVGRFKPWFRQRLFNFDLPVQGGLTNPVMPADVGAVTVAGQPAILRFGHNMPADVGALTVNGQAAGLQHGYKVTATLGTITLGGQPVNLLRTRVMPAAVGGLTVNGLAVTLRYAHRLPATLGTITINGQAVTLTRSPRNMAAGLATITLGGQSVALRYSRVPLTATLGTITVNGQAAIVRRGYMLAATLGQIVLSGQAVTLRRTRVMPATVGAITLSGQATGLRRGLRLPAGVGALTLGGQPVGLRVGRKVVATVGAITLNGQPVTLRQAHMMTAGVGAITLFGRVVNLDYSGNHAKVLPASLGLISLGGQPVTLRYARQRPSTVGAVTVNGLPVKLAVGRKLAAGSGSLVLAGQNVTLTYAPAAVIRHLVMPAGVCALVLDRKQVSLNFRQQPGVFTFGRRVTIPNRW